MKSAPVINFENIVTSDFIFYGFKINDLFTCKY